MSSTSCFRYSNPDFIEYAKLIEEETEIDETVIHGMTISLACSAKFGLEYLKKEVEKRHLLFFLRILLKDIPYEISLASDVDLQKSASMNDCGIFCLRRMYLMANFNVDATLFTRYKWNPIKFRLFILNTIFKFKRDNMSIYIYNKNCVINQFDLDEYELNKTYFEEFNINTDTIQVQQEEPEPESAITAPSSINNDISNKTTSNIAQSIVNNPDNSNFITTTNIDSKGIITKIKTKNKSIASKSLPVHVPRKRGKDPLLLKNFKIGRASCRERVLRRV